jgi:hypothetical protein
VRDISDYRKDPDEGVNGNSDIQELNETGGCLLVLQILTG